MDDAILKVGTGKTTRMVNLVAGLVSDGPDAFDRRGPPESALASSDTAPGLGFPVIGTPVRDLHRRVPDLNPDYVRPPVTRSIGLLA